MGITINTIAFFQAGKIVVTFQQEGQDKSPMQETLLILTYEKTGENDTLPQRMIHQEHDRNQLARAVKQIIPRLQTIRTSATEGRGAFGTDQDVAKLCEEINADYSASLAVIFTDFKMAIVAEHGDPGAYAQDLAGPTATPAQLRAERKADNDQLPPGTTRH